MQPREVFRWVKASKLSLRNCRVGVGDRIMFLFFSVGFSVSVSVCVFEVCSQEDALWTLLRGLSKHAVDGNESLIWKCNFAFLQSFLNYSKSSLFAKCVLIILKLNWNQRFRGNTTKLNICHHIHTSSTQLQNLNRSFHVVERTRTSSKCSKMKNAHTKRAKRVFRCQICKFVRVFFVAVVVVVA